MNKKIVTYRGEKIYIGIDVHKKTYTFSAYCQGLVCKTATTPADPKQFTRDIRKWFYGAQIISVYEAGFSGFNLHRELKSAGISNIVINPASLEIASKDKVKGRQEVAGVRRNRATCCARDEGRSLGVGRQGQASNYFATDNP